MQLEGEEFRPFVHHKDELSVNDRVLLWGSTVIVSPKARERESLMCFTVRIQESVL